MSKDVINPFDAQNRNLPSNVSATTAVEQQRAIAEVQASMLIARANPRNPQVAMDRILVACKRKGLAEQGNYQYARGGTDITGPSIVLAKAIAQLWGNITFGIRELEQANHASTVQAYAWDMETNTRQELVFAVPHERHTRSGKKLLTDPRDIYETVANQGARRMRACILSIIPEDVTDAAVEQCNLTLRDSLGALNDEAEKILQAFERYGVDQQMIEARIQRDISAITPAQVVDLKRIWVSLRDGMSSPESWFEMGPRRDEASDLNAQVQARREAQSAPVSRPAPEERKKEQAPAQAEPQQHPGLEEAIGHPVPIERNGIQYDHSSPPVPYNARFHASTKTLNNDGSWRTVRGCDKETYKRWLSSIGTDTEEPAQQQEEDHGQDRPGRDQGGSQPMFGQAWFNQMINGARTEDHLVEIEAVLTDQKDMDPEIKALLEEKIALARKTIGNV